MVTFNEYIIKLKQEIKDYVVADVFKHTAKVSFYSYDGDTGKWQKEKTFKSASSLVEYIFNTDILHDEPLEDIREQYEDDDFNEDETDLEPSHYYKEWSDDMNGGVYIKAMKPEVRSRILRFWEATPPIQDLAFAIVSE